jgi:hypothetical protein
MFEDESKEDSTEHATKQFLESIEDMAVEIDEHKDKQRKATNIIKHLIIKIKKNLTNKRGRTT